MKLVVIAGTPGAGKTSVLMHTVKSLQREGIIIRNTESFNLPGYSRVTIGTPEENRFFIKKLKKVLWKTGKREL